MNPDRAVIGYVHGGTVRQEFCESLLAAVTSGAVADVLAVASPPNISRARNQLTAMFLEDRDEPWLLMCDTDMWLPADTAPRLIAAADPVSAPVVGALCFGQRPGSAAVPMMYELRPRPDGTPRFFPLEDWPEDELIAVDAASAACLLLHRGALEAVAETSGDVAAPWFRQTAAGPLLLSEDLSFCLRCRDAGVPVHVHTGVGVGHMKTVMLTEGNRFG
jgi:hypothetical protein